MIMMSDYLFKEPPFPETFLHGLIYSKSYWSFDKQGALTYITGKKRTEYELGSKIPSGTTLTAPPPPTCQVVLQQGSDAF